MHIVAQLRPIDLHNFQAKYQRVVSFWVPVDYPSLNELVSMPGLWRIPTQFRLPPNTSLCKLPWCNDSALSWPTGGPFSLPLYSWRSQWVPFIARSIWAYVSPLSVLRPGSVQVENFFRPSGESNPRPWRWIKSARDQRVKCNERRTRPCHRAYSIRGSTPFHSCVEVRSPKLVSSEDRTGARAPSASYCSTEGVAPLHTAPPVPVQKKINFWFFSFSLHDIASKNFDNSIKTVSTRN